MRLGKRIFPTGAIGFASIAAGVVLFFANFALPLTPSAGDIFISLGGLAFAGGWILLFAWLVNGYRQGVTLQHTVRVGIWSAAGLFLYLAAYQLWYGLSGPGLKVVSWNLLVFYLGISAAFAAAGWRQWIGSSRAAQREDSKKYDDWSWGGAGDDGFDMD